MKLLTPYLIKYTCLKVQTTSFTVKNHEHSIYVVTSINGIFLEYGRRHLTFILI